MSMELKAPKPVIVIPDGWLEKIVEDEVEKAIARNPAEDRETIELCGLFAATVVERIKLEMMK